MNRSSLAWIALVGFASVSSGAVAQDARPAPARAALERIRVGDDGKSFVGATSGERFTVWGVNYDHDGAGRLLEDYWENEWDAVAADFGEIKTLGANVVRVHLQVGRFLDAPDRANDANLARLAKLTRLGETHGLRLDVTGLACYHRADVPRWYDELDEPARWEAQATFWRAVARVCRESSAIFCYDLMNEPVLPGDKKEADWLVGPPLDGKHFVQRVSRDLAGRSRTEVAAAWVKQLAAAIREVDDRTLITVGVIPWSQVFKGAKPIFYAPEVHGPLDFVSVHFYPRKDALEDDLAALAAYDVGKPLLIEELFPLNASVEQTDAFVEASRKHADGWVSFYWGVTIDEYEKKNDPTAAMIAAWLKHFRDRAPAMTAPNPK